MGTRLRENQIVEYVNERGIATVKELSDHFSVSEITIRRDLERLNEKRAVVRFHGGAKKRMDLDTSLTEVEFKNKSIKMLEEKKRIGKRASEFIESDDTVFMNSGTTVLQCLQYIDKKDVTIVTNNTAILDAPVNPGISVLLLGGAYSSKTRSVVGEIATENLMGIYSTCTILGVNALDINEGMTTSIYQESFINNAMINHTKGKVILLADSSKIGKVSSYVSSPISKINVIITDDKCPEHYVNAFRQQGVTVIVV